MAAPDPFQYQADVRIETAHSRRGLVLLTVECGDLSIAAVMTPEKARELAADIRRQADSAACAIHSN